MTVPGLARRNLGLRVDRTLGIRQDDSGSQTNHPGGTVNSSRRIAIVVPAAALGMMLGSWVAAADPGTIGGCSSGYELMTVKQVLKTIAAPGFEDSIRAKDANGDGYLCIKIIPNG